MPQNPKPLCNIFNIAFAIAFFLTVFIPFWLINLLAKRSIWAAAFSHRYLHGAYKLPTKLHLWKFLPIPRTNNTGWLYAFAFYALFSVLLAALFTAAVCCKRKAASQTPSPDL